ncbi:MAG: DnaJ family molecular chaperone [Rhizobiaceae bacterium]|nr:DnaJ family molecular chaperone [Rhizobiaceae bacterium]MCV0406553.1 DnaJ family molecular chaperone [Rhizobiaceae bacterium]
MTIWNRLGELTASMASGARAGIAAIVEAVKTAYAGDPELRRRVAFSVAMIALSAKMAKSDGVVSQNEIHAFHEIFHVPREEARNVTRLYDIAKADTAGFEAYAHQMAGLCGSGHRNCAMLEDILDGLFHIAKADGVVHEREVGFLRRVAEIFGIEELHFEAILARHASGAADPYKVLGVARGEPFATIKARYRKLVSENHPDRLIARGVPPEFVEIATARVAAINAAFEVIERRFKPA